VGTRSEDSPVLGRTQRSALILALAPTLRQCFSCVLRRDSPAERPKEESVATQCSHSITLQVDAHAISRWPRRACEGSFWGNLQAKSRISTSRHDGASSSYLASYSTTNGAGRRRVTPGHLRCFQRLDPGGIHKRISARSRVFSIPLRGTSRSHLVRGSSTQTPSSGIQHAAARIMGGPIMGGPRSPRLDQSN
jgi:hypothetical protein